MYQQAILLAKTHKVRYTTAISAKQWVTARVVKQCTGSQRKAASNLHSTSEARKYMHALGF